MQKTKVLIDNPPLNVELQTYVDSVYEKRIASRKCTDIIVIIKYESIFYNKKPASIIPHGFLSAEARQKACRVKGDSPVPCCLRETPIPARSDFIGIWSGHDDQAADVLSHDAQVRFLETSHVYVLEGDQDILHV
jgi:hypothetical protein